MTVTEGGQRPQEAASKVFKTELWAMLLHSNAAERVKTINIATTSGWKKKKRANKKIPRQGKIVS